MQKLDSLNKQSLAIIGGAGHQACAFYESKLLKKISSNFKEDKMLDSDYPNLLSINFSFNGISELGVVNPRLVSQELKGRLSFLKSYSINTVVLTCGSLFPFFESNNNLILIDWIKYGSKKISEDGVKKVGVMCSQSSSENSLFEKNLTSCGVEYVSPSFEIQNLTNDLISYGIKNNSFHNKLNLEKIYSFYREAGCDAIWLACTDLYYISAIPSSLSIYQSFDFMVDATIEHLQRGVL